MLVIAFVGAWRVVGCNNWLHGMLLLKLIKGALAADDAFLLFIILLNNTVWPCNQTDFRVVILMIVCLNQLEFFAGCLLLSLVFTSLGDFLLKSVTTSGATGSILFIGGSCMQLTRSLIPVAVYIVHSCSSFELICEICLGGRSLQMTQIGLPEIPKSSIIGRIAQFGRLCLTHVVGSLHAQLIALVPLHLYIFGGFLCRHCRKDVIYNVSYTY